MAVPVRKVEFRILGSLEAEADGRLLELGGPRDRKALGVLLLDAGRVVPVRHLVEALWDEPPGTASKQVRNAVGRLRRLLALSGDHDPVLTESGGYRLSLCAGSLDAQLFEARVSQASAAAAAGDVAVAAAALSTALSLWRGPLLAGLAGQVFDAAAIAWDERRWAVVETYCDHLLTLGRHREVAAELATVAANDRPRERAVRQLMLAFYRDGRRADALAVYQDTRRQLADELGIDPGPDLCRLHQQILSDHPALGIRERAAIADHAPASTATPPTSTATGGVSTLPPAVWDFTGRSETVAELRHMLLSDARRGQPVVITGPAGIGKTTLALRVGHELASDFPDGRLYLSGRGFDLSPADVSTLSYSALVALGVAAHDIPYEQEARLSLNRRIVHDRECLIVLDDVSEAQQVRALLAGSTSVVLVTSRLALEGLETPCTIRLGLFTPDEAREFLERAAGSARVCAEPDAAEEILKACGMLPLALRITGAKLRARPLWKLADIAARLADERDRLDELTASDLAVRASLALSYQHLAQPTRRLFHLIGALELPELAAWVAAAGLGISEIKAERELDKLADIGLIEPAGCRGRFRVHDLVRLYAREVDQSARSADVPAAFHLVADTAIRLAESADLLLPGGVRGLGISASRRSSPCDLGCDPMTWFAREEALLVALIVQGCKARQVTKAVRLALALAASLDLASGYDSWRKIASALLDAAGSGPQDPAGHAYALYLQGVLASELGQPKTAIKLLGDAAEMLRELRHHRQEGYAEIYLSNNYHGLGRIDLALVCADNARRAFLRFRDDQGLGYSALVRGYALINSGELCPAISELSQAINFFKTSGHRQGQAHALRGIAHAQSKQGNHEEAVASYQAAFTAFGKLINTADTAMLKLGLAQELNELGKPDTALSIAVATYNSIRQLNNPFLSARAQHMIARAETAQGEFESAAARLAAAAHDFAGLDARLWQARSLRDMGRAHQQAGKQDLARAAWTQALDVIPATATADAAEIKLLLHGE